MEVANPSLSLKDGNHLAAVLPAFLNNGYCFQIGEEDDSDHRSSPPSSDSSSSIGAESTTTDDDEDGEEVESKNRDGALGCLDSIEEALPIKRGLSNFFVGKSRSYQSLSEVATAKVEVVAKPENPFNKRRRLLMACKSSWSKRAKSYSSLLPPLPDDDDDNDEDRGCGSGGKPPVFPLMKKSEINDEREGRKEWKSARCFSLTDLQNV